MIDLHSHVLPGIDDGAGSLEESLEMCRLAAVDGCTALIATPHLRHSRYWNGDRSRLEALWRQVRAQVEGLELYLGGEIAIHFESYEELDQLPDGQLLTLAGSRYVLLELDWHGYGPDPVDMVHELRVAGWYPIIAHPERVAWLAHDTMLLRALVTHGAYLQLTAMSVTGELGSKARAAAEAMLEEELVHFVASDAHDTRLRRPGLGEVYRVIGERWGDARAQRLTILHPQAVLDDRALPPAA